MTAYPLWLEGDSLMAGAYGTVLGDIIATATGRDCVNTAVGGDSMALIRDRIVANPAYASRTLILWDGSEYPGYTDAVSYCDELATALASLGHSRFVLIPPIVGYGVNPVTALAVRTEMLVRWPTKVLDWRNWIANSGGALILDRMANYPADPTHPNTLAMMELRTGIVAWLATMEGAVGGAFQRNAFQNNAFQIAAVSASDALGGTTSTGATTATGGFNRKKWKDLLDEIRAQLAAEQASLKTAKQHHEEIDYAARAQRVEAIHARALALEADAAAQSLTAAASVARFAEHVARIEAHYQAALAREIAFQDDEDDVLMMALAA